MPPEISEKDLRHVFAYISKDAGSVDEQNHRIKFVVSTDKLDRDSEIVLPAAVAEAATRKGEFVDNPVALACHLHRLIDGMPPVIGSWDVSTLKATAHKVEMWLNFAVESKLGEEYWKLYSKRHMKAVSIGFRILDGHEEAKDGKRFYIITKIELYEISCVAVGANPQALSKFKAFYSSNNNSDIFLEKSIPSSVKQYFDGHFDDLKTILDQTKSELFEEISQLKTLIIADDGLAKHLLDDADALVDSCGERDKVEQLFKRIQNALKLEVNT